LNGVTAVISPSTTGLPRCATVNPRNNLAHCFSCGKNINNIDLMMLAGHDFIPAVAILEGWLEEHRRGLSMSEQSVASSSSHPS